MITFDNNGIKIGDSPEAKISEAFNRNDSSKQSIDVTFSNGKIKPVDILKLIDIFEKTDFGMLQIKTILNRILSLAESIESDNDATEEHKRRVQSEIDEHLNSIDTIVRSTLFHGQKLLAGWEFNFNSKIIQIYSVSLEDIGLETFDVLNADFIDIGLLKDDISIVHLNLEEIGSILKRLKSNT